MADNHAWTTQILAEPVQQFRCKVFMQRNRIFWRERRFVGVIDEAVIIHLRASGLQSAQITALEIRPHRAAEEISPDADLFIKQQFHMRIFGFEPRYESMPSSFFGRRV